MFVTIISSLLTVCCSHVPDHQAHRPSVPEPHTAQAQETAHLLHAVADRRAGEALSQTEVPRLCRKGGPRKDPQDDRRSGQDVVPEQTHQMEVRC